MPTLPELNGRQGAFPLLCTTTGLLCLAAFILLARLDWTDVVPPWDVGVAASIQGWSLPGILPFMLAVSWPGWSPQSWILVLAICGVLYWRGLKLAAPLALVAAVSHVIVRGIKGSINRLRPDLGLMPDGPLDPSFPSGHITQYTIFLGLLAYLAWRRLRPGWSRRLAVSVCLGLIVLVGPSRVYLGQHWPSDVLAGYLLGSGLLLLIIATIEWHQSRSTRALPWELTRRNRTR